MKTREVKSFDERMPKQGSFLQKKNFYFFQRRRRSQKQFQLMKCNENKIIKRLRNKDKNFSIRKRDAKTRKNKRKTTISYICIERAQCYKIRSFFEISATQFFYIKVKLDLKSVIHSIKPSHFSSYISGNLNHCLLISWLPLQQHQPRSKFNEMIQFSDENIRQILRLRYSSVVS
jgi:hypothetical protein